MMNLHKTDHYITGQEDSGSKDADLTKYAFNARLHIAAFLDRVIDNNQIHIWPSMDLFRIPAKNFDQDHQNKKIGKEMGFSGESIIFSSYG